MKLFLCDVYTKLTYLWGIDIRTFPNQMRRRSVALDIPRWGMEIERMSNQQRSEFFFSGFSKVVSTTFRCLFMLRRARSHSLAWAEIFSRFRLIIIAHFALLEAYQLTCLVWWWWDRRRCGGRGDHLRCACWWRLGTQNSWGPRVDSPTVRSVKDEPFFNNAFWTHDEYGCLI